jgi:simple sugar transport system substrate-binding protein
MRRIGQIHAALRVSAGAPIPDGELRGIDWLVEGVQGNLPRG